MTSVAQVVKSIGPKLVPFFKTVAIYFVVAKPYDPPTIFGAIIKCLPIVSLILFVVLHGMSLSKEYQYSRRIITGLLFCCIGDWCLVWPKYFEFGIVAFAIGHVHYIMAFGFKPLNLPLGICLYAVNVAGVRFIWSTLDGILLPGICVYSAILTMMCWRAMARARVFEDLWTWSKLCTCAGSIAFAISDFIIGVDKFVFAIDQAQYIIMATYYVAQLGIALSVVDEQIAQTSQMEKSVQTQTVGAQMQESSKEN